MRVEARRGEAMRCDSGPKGEEAAAGGAQNTAVKWVRPAADRCREVDADADAGAVYGQGIGSQAVCPERGKANVRVRECVGGGRGEVGM